MTLQIAPHSLPPGWAVSTLAGLIGDAGVFTDGDWVESADQDANGDVRLIQLADVGDGVYRDRSERFLTSKKATELDCTYLEVGDVLIARMPEPLGRACIFPGDSKRCVTVVDVCVVRSGCTEIDHRWIMWFTNSPQFRGRVAAEQSGSTRQRVSRKKLSRLLLNVPPSGEQRRIVAKIEELFSDLDAGVAALERAKANLKRYRASVLKAAVEGRLTEQWRAEHPDVEPACELLERILTERRRRWEEDQLKKFKATGKQPPKGWKGKYKKPAKPNTTDLPKLPTGWCWASIEQLNLAERPISYGVLQPGDDVENGVPLVRVCDVTHGRVAIDQLKRIDSAISNRFLRTIIQGGEVLLTIVGTIGRTAVAPPELAGANTARAVAVIPVIPPCQPCFLELVLREPSMRNRLTRAAHEVARKTLNLEDVRAAAIPLTSVNEQIEIETITSERLSQVDAAEVAIEHALQRATRLRQAILKRAFEGRLVPQDPNDEPADKLLDRIRAEAKSKPATKKTKRPPRLSKKKPSRPKKAGSKR